MESAGLPIFFQPFSLTCEYSEEHLVVYFEDHPEYAWIEGIFSPRENPDLCRVILAERRGGRVHYVNSEEIAERLNLSGLTAHWTKIEYHSEKKSPKPRIRLALTTHREESLEVVLNCRARPEESRGGLSDPGGAPTGGLLPVIWRRASAMAGRGSKVIIDGRNRPISAESKFPYLNPKLAAFFTQGFDLGLVAPFAGQLNLTRGPAEMGVGQSWVYQYGEGELEYEIVGLDGDRLTVRRHGEKTQTIFARLTEGAIDIRRIEAGDGSLECGFALNFIAPPPGANLQAQFSIDITGHPEVIKGVFQADLRPNRVVFSLVPTSPPWAMARTVSVGLARQDKTLIMEPVVPKVN